MEAAAKKLHQATSAELSFVSFVQPLSWLRINPQGCALMLAKSYAYKYGLENVWTHAVVYVASQASTSMLNYDGAFYYQHLGEKIQSQLSNQHLCYILQCKPQPLIIGIRNMVKSCMVCMLDKKVHHSGTMPIVGDYQANQIYLASLNFLENSGQLQCMHM